MKMMDSPLYSRSYWNVPSHPRRSPSVREIPVHYVGSEQCPRRTDSAVKIRNRSDSALTIQKVFRGFLVRKNVKKIAEIRSEVEEIDKSILNKESIGLIGRDSKERLKINEMLMNLLFRLDSVRGVDSGVRDFRKTVIKKAIALQEFLDHFVSSNNENDQILEDDAVDNVEKIVEAVDQNQTIEAKVECTEDGGNSCYSMPENNEAEEDNEIVENQNGVEDENLNGVEDKETIKCQIEEPVKSQIDDRKDREDVEDYNAMPTVGDCPEERVGTSQIESPGDSSANTESLIEACEEDDISSLKQENNAIKTDEAENMEVSVKESSGPREEYTRNRELLERMVEDNGKMMDLLARLFERNDMQTRMLCLLSHRVEQLERAFMCEKLRKKKRQAAGIVDGYQASPDNKKCWKKV